MHRAKIIHIHVETGATGILYARSPDLPKLNVAARTEAGLMEALPAVIKAMMAAEGKEVRVLPAEQSEDASMPPPWVAVPDGDGRTAL